MRIRAPAKVNLTLEVLKRRDDSYHEIRSILQTIDLCDELELEESQKSEFLCDKHELNNEDNLTLRALKLLQKKTGMTKAVRIRLKKFIPVAAGLGGGSSDAAATLKGLNALWGLDLSADKLMEIAAELGSDVPFFIHGGIALARGRGEIIEPLPSPGEYWFVLLIPSVDTYSDKTSRMYHNLTRANFTGGESTETLANIIKAGDEIEESLLYNVFDEVAPKIYPQLSFFRELLAETAGTDKVHMAGSGPCLFVMIRDEARAKHIWSSLVQMKYKAYLSKSLIGTA